MFMLNGLKTEAKDFLSSKKMFLGWQIWKDLRSVSIQTKEKVDDRHWVCMNESELIRLATRRVKKG